MVARVTNNFRLFQAKSMVDGLKDTDQSDVFYLYTGHSTPINGINDDVVPTPGIDYDALVANYNTMISMSRILVGGIGRVTRRYNWTRNSFYRPFHTHGELHNISADSDLNNGPLAGFPYYVVNTDTSTGTPRLNVYKCLYVPFDIINDVHVLSTVAPTGTDISPFETGDGYRWKFLYTIAPSESLIFNTSEWLFASERISPRDRELITTGSIKERQLNVQDNTTKGEVWSISVLNGGSGLVNGRYDVTLQNGTYQPFDQVYTGTAIVEDSELKAINIDSSGRGYNGLPTVIFGLERDSDVAIDSQPGAVLPITHVNVADGEGHGANIPAELNATTVMMNARIIHEAGQNEFMTQNDFRQIGVIRNPVDVNTNTLALRDHYRLTNYLDIANPISDLRNDNIIISGGMVSARVVGLGSSTDSDDVSRGYGTRIFYSLIDQTMNFTTGAIISLTDNNGGATGSPQTALSVSDPEIAYDSGDILYVENRKPINRATDQIESYNIVFGF